MTPAPNQRVLLLPLALQLVHGPPFFPAATTAGMCIDAEEARLDSFFWCCAAVLWHQGLGRAAHTFSARISSGSAAEALVLRRSVPAGEVEP